MCYEEAMIGFWQLIVVLVIVVLIFGPSRLEKLGPALGKTIRGFKKGLSGEKDKEKDENVIEVDSDDQNKNV